MKCNYCGAENIEVGIQAGIKGDTGALSLKYDTAFYVGTASVYVDLCRDCGGIVKMYIKDRTDRNWLKA